MSQKIKQDISIGDNLKKLRNATGLTQDQVTAQLQIKEFKIGRERLSQMENGKYNIRVSVLVALKKIYNCSYHDFFEGLEK